MSITHILKFESDYSQSEILNLLLTSGLGISAGKYDQMKAEGVYGRVFPIDRDGQNLVFEKYGFKPDLRVSFDEDSDGDVEEGEKIMGKAVALILSQEKGDAIFFYVVDTPILRRINGQIEVADDVYFDWLRNALTELNLEYRSVSKETLETNR